jgi:hypothetical protein
MANDKKSDTKQNYDDRKYEELRLLYSLVLDDIRFHKNQQITFLYYTIALYSVPVFLATLTSTKNTGGEFKIALMVMSLLTMLIGIWFTYIAQSDINKGRIRVSKICPHFTKEFNDALERDKVIKRTLNISRYTYLIFILIQVIAEIIVLYILWSNLYS